MINNLDLFKYDLFLSYSEKDKQEAETLWYQLTSGGLNVFWSDISMKKDIGKSFLSTIEKALESSKHFVLLWTCNAVKSEWVKKEYSIFSIKYIKTKERRVIIFEGTDYHLAVLPTILSDIQTTNSIKDIISIVREDNIVFLKRDNAQLNDELILSKIQIEMLQSENFELKKIKKLYSKKIKGYKKKLEEYKVKKDEDQKIINELQNKLKDLVKKLKKYKDQQHIQQLEIKKSNTNLTILRSTPELITELDIKAMLKSYDFFEIDKNNSGNFKNDFVETLNNTITDLRTGLMWQKSGTEDLVVFNEVNEYISAFNKMNLSGFNNWRLPTIEELASLLEPKKNSALFLSHFFCSKQSICWSADNAESKYWCIDFKNGVVGLLAKKYCQYIKVVRTIESKQIDS